MAGVSFGGHDIASPHFPAELSLPLSPIFPPPVRGEFPCLKGGIFPCPLDQGISARFLWPGFLSRLGLSARVLRPCAADPGGMTVMSTPACSQPRRSQTAHG